VWEPTLNNCTLVGNLVALGEDRTQLLWHRLLQQRKSRLRHCIHCHTPCAESGSGNITNEPAFVNFAGDVSEGLLSYGLY
jgi:hypothetical protein